VNITTDDSVDTTANQTVRLNLGTKDGVKSMRIGFTDQRLTAHGGLAVWTGFITERGLRAELRTVLPHTPTSPNAYDPTDTALGFIGGILCGADKLARVAHLAHDPAVAEVLGIEAIPSQSTLSRFFARCGRGAGEALSGLHRWAVQDLPERTEGYTLDLDSFSLIHEDGHQEGVRVGYAAYRDQGFEIIGISCDVAPEHASKAITKAARTGPQVLEFCVKNDMPWQQYYEGRTHNTGGNYLAARFGVTGIPAAFLLDQSGDVVAMNLRGEKL
jgi:hypothetical protein